MHHARKLFDFEKYTRQNATIFNGQTKKTLKSTFTFVIWSYTF